MRSVLPRTFFDRPTLQVAHDLLGKFLVRRWRGRSLDKARDREIAVMITEVEAYDGPHDKASHASRGRTPRTEVMFGEAGRWYIYLIYGMYWMLNIVAGPKNYPAAVLIRGGVVAKSQNVKRISRAIKEIERKNRSTPHDSRYTNIHGPGKLTKFLKIDKKINTRPATRKTGLWIEDRGVKIKKSEIQKGKRIGVSYAKEWAEKPYRFFIKD